MTAALDLDEAVRRIAREEIEAQFGLFLQRFVCDLSLECCDGVAEGPAFKPEGLAERFGGGDLGVGGSVGAGHNQGRIQGFSDGQVTHDDSSVLGEAGTSHETSVGASVRRGDDSDLGVQGGDLR